MLICDESSLLQIITFYFLSLIHTLDIIVVVIVFVVVFVVLEVNLLKNLIVLFVFPRREFRKILISAKKREREREKEAETKLYINIQINLLKIY